MMNDFDEYRPSPLWFVHKPCGIHGVSHATRTFVWANAIGTCLQRNGETLNLEAVRWAAVLHDVGRLSDGWDRGHGTRSAEWIVSHRESLPDGFPDEVTEIIAYCCRWHEISDGAIPLMTLELMCIKDADGLDRVRINDLNPGYLRSEPARILVDRAWELYRETVSGPGSWDAVMKVAQEKEYIVIS
jgi:HD superfamily phosphodiesterase